MAKYKLTIHTRGDLPEDKKATILEVLKFTPRKEKSKPHQMTLFGASPKKIDNDLIDKAIKKAKATMNVNSIDINDGDDE